MNHSGTQLIESERLLLRPFIRNDSDAMYTNWSSDLEVTKFLSWPAHENESVSAQILDEWVQSYEKQDFYQWAIVLKTYGNRPIGSIGAVQQDDKTSMLQVGYCLGKSWWHQGIMSEALKLVIAFFFEKVGANRIEARFDPRNPNSGMVMQKCGMTYEGTFRQADWNNQGLCDSSYYAILRADFYA